MTPDLRADTEGGTAHQGDRAPASGRRIGAVVPEDRDSGSLPLLLAFIAIIVALGAIRSWWIPGIIAGLLFMLFMHELGHFVSARASGMKVTEFFLGFGPKIWSFRRGETEYGVKAIPAGAYVRILGMTNLDEIDPAEEHRTYRAQPYWQRMITICAGSAMHFTMAVVCGFVLFGGFGYTGANGPPWVVDQIVAGSSAQTLGIEVGDSLQSVNGETFHTWDEFGETISSIPPGPLNVVLQRDGETMTLSGELGPRSQDVVIDGFGLVINEESTAGWEVSYLYAGEAAEEIGLEVGDVLLAVGGVERPSQFELAQVLAVEEGSAIDFVVDRDAEVLTITDVVTLKHDPEFRGFLGIGPGYVEQPAPSWAESVGLAFGDFGVIAKENARGLIDLVNPVRWLGSGQPDVERRAADLPVHGTSTPIPTSDEEPGNRPVSMIGIARLFAQSESVDEVLFLFMAVNIFIGMFNLVPLLPLDGGHAAIATYERIREAVTRAPHRVDAARLVPVTWAVMILLVGVGLWAAVLDVFSWPA